MNVLESNAGKRFARCWPLPWFAACRDASKRCFGSGTSVRPEDAVDNWFEPGGRETEEGASQSEHRRPTAPPPHRPTAESTTPSVPWVRGTLQAPPVPWTVRHRPPDPFPPLPVVALVDRTRRIPSRRSASGKEHGCPHRRHAYRGPRSAGQTLMRGAGARMVTFLFPHFSWQLLLGSPTRRRRLLNTIHCSIIYTIYCIPCRRGGTSRRNARRGRNCSTLATTVPCEEEEEPRRASTRALLVVPPSPPASDRGAISRAERTRHRLRHRRTGTRSTRPPPTRQSRQRLFRSGWCTGRSNSTKGQRRARSEAWRWPKTVWTWA